MAHTKTLNQLRYDINASLNEVEEADDPTAPFAQLKTHLEEYLRRTADLIEDWFKQQKTITQQAKVISDLQLQDAIGLPAPSDTPSAASFHANFPDLVSIEKHPDCLFIPISAGFVNLLQISFLDVPGKAIYLNSGNVRTLEPADIQRINYHCQLYQSADSQAIRPPQAQELIQPLKQNPTTAL